MPDAPRTSPRPRGRFRLPPSTGGRIMTLVAGLALIGGVVWMVRGGVTAGDVGGSSTGPATQEAPAAPEVEVVRPTRGGIVRETIQPGSVHAFESVDLYSKVAGYLKSQAVDIGARVSKGQVLAEVDVPEEEELVEEADAMLGQAKAQAMQAEARIETAEARRAIAEAQIAQAEADDDKATSARALAEKQYERIRGLYSQSAVDRKLVDEQEHQLDSARAAERSARAAIQTAKAQLAAAVAGVAQARSDLIEAQAAVQVAEAKLARARVVVDYARIVAPFDGVVTRRNFFPSAFIRSAADGGQPPLLTVKRTDLMRVILQVPDRDVVLADVGDPAEVTIDALGGKVFDGTVSRIGESEDPTTRTMRVEIDLPNPDGQLREGMYGRATITLQPPSKSLAVPSGCITSHSGRTAGAVHVVRNGKVHRLPVELGQDNGVLVEVVSGLGPDDDVVLRASGPIEDGMEVLAKVASEDTMSRH